MSYTENDLYKLNIMQLREIGRTMYIKGTTNKKKEELVDSIIDKSKKKETNSGVTPSTAVATQASVAYSSRPEDQKAFADELLKVNPINNAMVQTQKGYCIINDDDYLCKIYDEYLQLTDIVIPYGLVKKEFIQDGDFIVFKQSVYKEQKFVTIVLSINSNLVISQQKPSRKLVRTKEVFGYIAQNAKSTQNSVAVIPVAIHDEMQVLSESKVEIISSLISSLDSIHELTARLAVSRMLQKVAKGKNIAAFVDLDRLFLVYSLKSDVNIAKMKLVKFFASAAVYEDGSSLSIVGVTSSPELVAILQSFCTEFENIQ
jgi:hypothetical protein